MQRRASAKTPPDRSSAALTDGPPTAPPRTVNAPSGRGDERPRVRTRQPHEQPQRRGHPGRTGFSPGSRLSPSFLAGGVGFDEERIGLCVETKAVERSLLIAPQEGHRFARESRSGGWPSQSTGARCRALTSWQTLGWCTRQERRPGCTQGTCSPAVCGGRPRVKRTAAICLLHALRQRAGTLPVRTRDDVIARAPPATTQRCCTRLRGAVHHLAARAAPESGRKDPWRNRPAPLSGLDCTPEHSPARFGPVPPQRPEHAQPAQNSRARPQPREFRFRRKTCLPRAPHAAIVRVIQPGYAPRRWTSPEATGSRSWYAAQASPAPRRSTDQIMQSTTP